MSFRLSFKVSKTSVKAFWHQSSVNVLFQCKTAPRALYCEISRVPKIDRNI